MQRRYEKEQRLLEQLEEVAKSHQAERVAQKAKREAKEKAWEEAERQRVAEEEGDKEGVGLCNRYEGGIYAKKMKHLSIVKRRKGRGERIH